GAHRRRGSVAGPPGRRGCRAMSGRAVLAAVAFVGACQIIEGTVLRRSDGGSAADLGPRDGGGAIGSSGCIKGRDLGLPLYGPACCTAIVGESGVCASGTSLKRAAGEICADMGLTNTGGDYREMCADGSFHLLAYECCPFM